MIFIKKIIHTAIRQIGKTFRLTQHIPGHHNRDKRLPIHTTNSNAIRIVVNNLYGHSSESNHYLPPFASSLIMHVLTNAEKLIPRRDAASLAESRKLAGIRIVTGTTSPFTRYERISVSPASCSIRSEYVIAFYTFKLQYKCNNSTPAWEQRKLSEVATFGGGHTPPMADPDNYEDGYVLWVTSQDVKSNYLDRTTTQITEKGAKELTLYPAGSLVMVTRSGILRHTPPVAELRKPSTVNQDIRVILPQGECCGEWLLQFFISHNKELLLEFGKTGTTVESVDFGKIKDMLLYMPSTVEQQQIGDFFAKLDSLITLHQRKRLSIRQRSPVWS